MAKSCIDGNNCHHLLNVLGDNDGYISFAFPIVNLRCPLDLVFEGVDTHYSYRELDLAA